MNNTQYPELLNIPVVHGEITVVTSTNAEASMKHSAKLAAKANSIGLNTLIINCGMSHKRYNAHFTEHYEHKYKKPRLMLRSYVSGNMIDNAEEIDAIAGKCKISFIVINGWEFVADNYRRRNRLICFLRELMRRHEVVVVIYCHNARNPIAGHIDHGGIGKLALLAIATVKLDTSVYFEETEPSPDVHVTTEEESYNRAVWGAHHSVKEINELQGEVREVGEVRSVKSEVRTEEVGIENLELRIEKDSDVIPAEAGIHEDTAKCSMQN